MEPGTWHLYAYCANNPVNYVDPSGHKSKWVSAKKTKRYYTPVIDAGHQVFRVRASMSVNYNDKKSGKKILNMHFSAIGDKHSNCDDGWCSLVDVKIYKGKKRWKKIKGYSKLVTRGPGVIINKSSCVYLDKKITKNYSVGKKKTRVKAKFAFLPPKDALWRGGMSIFLNVKF